MTDTRPVTEMSPWASTILGRPYLCGLCVSDGDHLLDHLDAEIAFTKAKGATALYLHLDSAAHWNSGQVAAAKVTAAGLTPIWGTHIVDSWQVVTDATPLWGLTLSCRTGDGVDLTRRRDALVAAIERVAQGGCSVVWLFNVVDGDGHLKDRWPAAWAYLSAVIAAVATPEQFPGVAITPPASPPVQPQPPPAPPKPSKGVDWIAITGAIATGLVALFKWRPWRKKPAK